MHCKRTRVPTQVDTGVKDFLSALKTRKRVYTLRLRGRKRVMDGFVLLYAKLA